jgi:hypothetical protein
VAIREEIQQLKFTGAVDADGHILEDAGLWDRYLESEVQATVSIRQLQHPHSPLSNVDG